MESILGTKEPAGANATVAPLSSGDESLGPDPITLSPPPGSVEFEFSSYLYEHVAFILVENSIEIVIVDESGARTRRGVEIGGDLDEARSVYPKLTCGTANEGSEHLASFPACTGPVGERRFIWFGGDPIQNITVGSVPFGPVT